MRTEESAAHAYTATWCKDGEIGYVALSGGARVRYLRVGVGPPLVLMHTVRTQLDHFQFVIPRMHSPCTRWHFQAWDGPTSSRARGTTRPHCGPRSSGW